MYLIKSPYNKIAFYGQDTLTRDNNVLEAEQVARMNDGLPEDNQRFSK